MKREQTRGLSAARETFNVNVLVGAEEILGHTVLLEDFALACGHPGSLSHLAYFVAQGAAIRKRPWLVLVYRDDALWAVCLYMEHQVLGIGTRFFRSDDMTGFRSVVTFRGQECEAAAICTDALLRRGAILAATTYLHSEQDRGYPAQRIEVSQRVECATQTRETRQQVCLGASLEDTLRQFGKATRVNLRYYRRRLVKDVPHRFVVSAGSLLSETDILHLNSHSLNPVDPSLMRLRFQGASTIPGGFVMGLRRTSGEWLSVMGGWRQAGTTVLHWQVNSRGYEKRSIGTAMRNYFLENESDSAQTRIVFYGGTTHSMQHSFPVECSSDLLVRRTSWWSRLLIGFARRLMKPPAVAGNSDLLARVLHDDSLRWHCALRQYDMPCRDTVESA